jgi:hypothetical protein
VTWKERDGAMRRMGERKTEDWNNGCRGRGVVLSSLAMEVEEEEEEEEEEAGQVQGVLSMQDGRR